MVPARLRFEHRSKRLGVLGLSPDGRLRSLMDSRLRPFPSPRGVRVDHQAGRDPGSRPGDALQIEILEGKRPVNAVVVSKLVDELIGISAYMDIRALHRLMEEEPTVSGAYLAVDPFRPHNFIRG